MSREIKYIGMDGDDKEAIVIAVLNGSGKLVMENHRRNPSQQHCAVPPRSAGRAACDLGRRDVGGVAVRSAAAAGGASCGSAIRGAMPY